jgi:transcriptional regulator with XRE-family HTH domain
MTLETERGDSGELEAPQEGLWLRSRRLAVGLTLTALARQLGAPIQTVSRWEHGESRPPWPWPLKLAAALTVEAVAAVTVEDVLEHLWGERKGDPCPRHQDCPGTKIRPDDPVALATLQPALRQYAEKALRLLIKVTCARCPRSHAYPAYGPHPRLCPVCSKVVKVDDVTGTLRERVERITCICQGYHRYGTTLHYGPSCLGKRTFTPGEANEFSSGKKRPRQSWRKYPCLDEDGKIRWARTSGEYADVEWKKPFVNLSEQTFRCRSCGFASLRFNVRRAQLEMIEGEKILSEAQHKSSWKGCYRHLTPGFDPLVGLAQRKLLGKEKLYGKRHAVATSIGRTITSWLDPKNNEAVVDLCPVCLEINFYWPSNPTQFHSSCYDSVRGEVRKGTRFSRHKTGPAANISSNLKRAFCWAVRHLLNDEDFSEIAKDRVRPRPDRNFVRREVKRVISLLPVSDKLSLDFKKIVSMVREAAAKKGLLSTDSSNSPETRAQSGSEG